MDDTFRLLWRRHRTWADTSAHLGQVTAAWKRNVLVLMIGGTAFATLGSFAPGTPGRVLPMMGAAALALATYFGMELLDARRDERWTRARAAAAAFKSEAQKYLVQAAPYDGPDRASRLEARMGELEQVVKDQVPDPISPERATLGMPETWWTVDDYLTARLGDQVRRYRQKAHEQTEAMGTGRTVSLMLGAAAAVLSALVGAAAQAPALAVAALGVVTTGGAALGAYFQAMHYDARALTYRETANALEALKASFTTSPPRLSRAELVSRAEAIMQAEHAAWLPEVTARTGV